MSCVSNVILNLTGERICEDNPEDYRVVRELNKTLGQDHRTTFLRIDPFPCGGYKAWEATTLFAAFNNVHMDVLLEKIGNAGWRFPEEIQVLVQIAEEDRFQNIRFFYDDKACKWWWKEV